ncbi:MAG: winged helix-turn-helix transcriptional regulator [Elusimicrobia bacterium]|nr:winged helix-turn-helix transcriptional regulator [Elusimicrobiota bacterium]
MAEITTKELKVINSISKNNNPSQRDIATDVGLSLGMTNILINRLVKKGYVKVRKLSAKKIKYFITARGLKEKTRKSYKFMMRSFSVINKLKKRIEHYAIEEYNKGGRSFVILGEGELSFITELVLGSLKFKDVTIRRVSKENINGEDAVVFNTAHDSANGFKSQIDIWTEAEKLYGSNYEF